MTNPAGAARDTGAGRPRQRKRPLHTARLARYLNLNNSPSPEQGSRKRSAEGPPGGRAEMAERMRKLLRRIAGRADPPPAPAAESGGAVLPLAEAAPGERGAVHFKGESSPACSHDAIMARSPAWPGISQTNCELAALVDRMEHCAPSAAPRGASPGSQRPTASPLPVRLRLRNAAIIRRHRLKAEACSGGTAEAAAELAARQRRLETYLPGQVIEAFRKTGVTRDLYQWQAEALNVAGVLAGGNLVYSAPTSAGKSAVAEVLMLRRVIHTKRPALLVLPFVSLCSEKVAHLERLLAPLNREVRAHYSDKGALGPITEAVGAIVCTFEKANGLMCRLLEEEALGQLSCIVVDELHMVGDTSRGYLLELLLTKLRYATADIAPEDVAAGEGVQIVGMSATMPNARAVADWLGAQLYETTFRPVPLAKYIKVGAQLVTPAGEVVQELPPRPQLARDEGRAWREDRDHAMALTWQTVRDGKSVLIFCATKRECEATALQAKHLLGSIPERAVPGAAAAAAGSQVCRASLEIDLRRVPGGGHHVLAETLPFGVAFHYSTLESEEKRIVETAFRVGAVRVLAATSTLAAGVNLPAARVILRHHYQGLKRPENFLTSTEVRQMAGRAGRTGLDETGEAIIIVPERDEAAKKYIYKVMQDCVDPVRSCLSIDELGMKRAVLEAVASRAVVSARDVKKFAGSTLLNHTDADCTTAAPKGATPAAGAAAAPKKPGNAVSSAVVAATLDALHWLRNARMLCLDGDKWAPRPLGLATQASGLPPQDALLVKQDLDRAMSSLNQETDLHLAFLVTPVHEKLPLKDEWTVYNMRFSRLKGCQCQVERLVGLDLGCRSWLQGMATGGRLNIGNTDHMAWARVCRRLYAALVLDELLQEVSVKDVVATYQLDRAAVEGLQVAAGKYAGRLAAFCDRLGYSGMEVLLARFQARVSHGVRQEIVALTELAKVGAVRARLLFASGLRTPEAIAAAEVAAIETALAKGERGADGGGKPARAIKRSALLIKKSALESVRQLARKRAEEAAAAAAALAALGSAAPATQDGHGASPASGSGSVLSGASVARMTQGLPPLEKGVVLVEGGATAGFCTAWAAQERWAFAVDFTPLKGAHGDPELALPPLPGVSAHAAPTPLLSPEEALDAAAAAHAAVRLHGIAVAWTKDAVFYVRAAPEHWEAIAGVFERGGRALACNGTLEGLRQEEPPAGRTSSATLKVTHGAKDQLRALAGVCACEAGSVLRPVELGDAVVDVRVVAWLLDPDACGDSSVSDSLEQDARARKAATVEGLLGRVNREAHDKAAATARLGKEVLGRRGEAEQACVRAAMAWRLYENQCKQMKLQNLGPAMGQVEGPLARVLASMESTGLAVSRRVVREHKAPLRARLYAVPADVADVVRQLRGDRQAGRPPDLSSPLAVSQLLFNSAPEGLALEPPPGAHRNKNGTLSTADATLEDLAAQYLAGAGADARVVQLIRLIQEHRGLSKYLNDFTSSIERHTGESAFNTPGCQGELVRISATILQSTSATGRLATEAPNLQCIPRPRAFQVYDSHTPAGGGPKGLHEHNANLRAAFVAPPGRVLLSADYGQLELRLMAHFSADEGLVAMLSDPGQDPFTLYASQWLGTPLDQVTPAQRTQAKAIAYGLLYGKGRAALAAELGIAPGEAARLMDSFRRSIPGLDAWLTAAVRDCKATRTQHIETLGARRRYLTDITSEDGTRRSRAERQAVNSICQGSAADLVKWAMVDLHARLRAAFPSPCACRLLLQVHDELLFEMEAAALPAAARLVRERMAAAGNELSRARGRVGLRVPLTVKLNVGRSWGELTPYEPPLLKG
ncbi:hypothetical protein WJX81_001769 [Elliptochloris bilobata]|uniref:DNA-directed DNA polymerase n=1 Tax=Elliptochloris bilobata TaxID=381761 RepID=A0AAW1RTG0_9CHLO